MKRWLWVWFFLLLSFPVMQPASLAQLSGLKARPAGAATTRPRADDPAISAKHPPAQSETPASAWGGPLAAVIDRLDWVPGRASSRSALAGHVVIVEFWTFDCVNCRRTLPAMRALEHLYRGGDVRVIGIHTPELARERDPAAVARAVAREGIEYPVALDPGLLAWSAFGNRYWPCLYVLDASGEVRYRHIGELHEGSGGWDEFIREVEAPRVRRRDGA